MLKRAPRSYPRSMPVLEKNMKHSMTYSNTEYLCDVFSASTGQQSGYPFTTTNFVLNAGLFETFPSLSTIASNYEMYRFRYLEFFYKPLVNDKYISSAQQSVGSVGMVCVYDPYEPLINITPQGVALGAPQNFSSFPNKLAFLNQDGAVSAPSGHYLRMKVKYDPGGRGWYYTRIGEFVGPQVGNGQVFNEFDFRMTDLGWFSLMVSDCLADNTLLGELYVRYVCDLKQSRVMYPLGNLTRFSHYRAFSPSHTNMWNNLLAQPGSTIDCAFGVYHTSITTNTSYCIFPQCPVSQTYMVTIYIQGSLSDWNVTVATVNCTTLDLLNAGDNWNTNFTNDTNQILITFFLQTDVQGLSGNTNQVNGFSIADGGSFALNTPQAMDLFITQIPSYIQS